MIDDVLSRSKKVTDPAAAAAFASSRLRRLVMLFAAAPLSLSEAAARGNYDLKRLHHHVGRLVKLGLLKVCGIRPRGGRPIKIYRAVSDSFFVPEELFPRPFGEELAHELREGLAAAAARSARGLLLTVGPNGEPVGRVITEPRETRGTFEYWRVLRLSESEFEQLKAEIDAVLRRFEAKPVRPSHVYLVHAAAARRSDDSGLVDNP
ncbi:MAG TPA: hypothetical protein VJM15_11285 [Sphingomicrobium sp.]|nr:hypothetical protein [Sphingomicrobium sp.]